MPRNRTEPLRMHADPDSEDWRCTARICRSLAAQRRRWGDPLGAIDYLKQARRADDRADALDTAEVRWKLTMAGAIALRGHRPCDRCGADLGPLPIGAPPRVARCADCKATADA